MPIRPIEIMKSQEASQYKHIESQRIQHEQVQVEKSFQSMIKEEATKTTQTAKGENTNYRYDAKEKGRNSYSGSGSRKQKKEEEKGSKEGPKGPTRPGGIDILI